MEIRLAGTGGQGLITGTIILAEAGIMAGKYVAQSQSYGPEARGGMCKGEVIISDEKIGYTKVTSPTFVMALSQLSFDQYCKNVSDDCFVLADESLAIPDDFHHEKFRALPILAAAREKVGKMQTVNIVSVGAICALLGLFSEEQLKEAVLLHIPKGTEELNLKALSVGAGLVK